MSVNGTQPPKKDVAYHVSSSHKEDLERYLTAIVDKRLCPSGGRLRRQMSYLYDGIDFAGKSIIDIGGGSGVHSYYAACRGAKNVVCLEPEAAGSSHGVRSQFEELGSILGYTNVMIKSVTLQAFDAGSRRFDIVILHDSINHLDEEACIKVKSDANARLMYQKLFARIYNLAAEDARLVICDCSRHNFFSFLGVRNPFDPNIEWHKHQSPRLWASMLEEAGFAHLCTKWASPGRLGWVGRVLFANRYMAYFFTSHFCVIMAKQCS